MEMATVRDSYKSGTHRQLRQAARGVWTSEQNPERLGQLRPRSATPERPRSDPGVAAPACTELQLRTPERLLRTPERLLRGRSAPRLATPRNANPKPLLRNGPWPLNGRTRDHTGDSNATLRRPEDAIGIQKASGGSLFACGALHEPHCDIVDRVRTRSAASSHVEAEEAHQPVASA